MRSTTSKRKSVSSPKGLVVAIIPARSGSKGIPLKNLREIGFKPLISHTIDAALRAKTVDRVVVSTDSARIAEEAREAGAEVPFLRPSELADDKTPLAAVMKHFLTWARSDKWNIKTLVILEPTSPLRTELEIDAAVRLFGKKKVDTVVSVEKDTSLGWEINEDGNPRPLEPERLNRQYLRPKFKENGAIFVTKPAVVTNKTTIGKTVALYEMTTKKSIDVNTYWDMQLTDLLLRNVKIVFHFKATAELGFGHFYRALALANRLYYNEIVFLCSEFDEGLKNRISTIGFKYYLSTDPINALQEIGPTILINDVLDTTEEFMQQIRSFIPLIVNFEDLGPGTKYADLTFNALYEGLSLDPSHHGGAHYAIMREEFLFLSKRIIREKVEVITATFGGSDPNNIVFHCAEILPEHFPNIEFRFILGPGYKHDKDAISKCVATFSNGQLIDASADMVKHLSESDIVITSGGRTVFEAAACGTPCIVICQNERELKHRHITSRDGVINLGLFEERESVSNLVEAIKELVRNPKHRTLLSERSRGLVDGLGIFRVIGFIEKIARVKGITKIL